MREKPEPKNSSSKPPLDAARRNLSRQAGDQLAKSSSRRIRNKPKEKYDVFISFKELGQDGKPTRDSQLAQDVFEFLSARQLRVFYSRASLKRIGASAFKQVIDAASVLVAVGTSAFGSFYGEAKRHLYGRLGQPSE